MTQANLNPIAEMAALQQRRAEAAQAHEREKAEIQTRLDALEALKRPIHLMLSDRYQLRRAISNVARLAEALATDAQAARADLRRQLQVTQEHGALHAGHLRMFQLENLAAEAAKYLATLTDERAELEAGILEKATAAGLKAMLPANWPADLCDE